MSQYDHNQSAARPISEVTDLYRAFSASVHATIVMLNGGILALLQLTANQQTTGSVFEANRAVFINFCVLIFFYAVLRVYEESKYLMRQFGLITRIVARMSHMFGSLATLVLISIISPIFALVLLLLWFLCLVTFVYFFCSEVISSFVYFFCSEVISLFVYFFCSEVISSSKSSSV